MNIEKIKLSSAWFVLLSECSHLFCCLLPSLFSILSLLSSIGLIVSVPPSLEFIHELIHNWEVPIIIGSAVILLFAWALLYISFKMDCHSTGCTHEPCEPRKFKSSYMLKIATTLYIINVSVYYVFHYRLEN